MAWTALWAAISASGRVTWRHRVQTWGCFGGRAPQAVPFSSGAEASSLVRRWSRRSAARKDRCGSGVLEIRELRTSCSLCSNRGITPLRRSRCRPGPGHKRTADCISLLFGRGLQVWRSFALPGLLGFGLLSAECRVVELENGRQSLRGWRPGTCAAGRVGIPCSRCEVSMRV